MRFLPLFLLLALSAAQAAPTKIFVASFGNDANDGSRGSPKRNFQAAHDAVDAGGQIVVLDTAGYGKLVIGKALGVTVPPGVNAFISATTAEGIVIAAGASDRVSLQGLIIEVPTAAINTTGVKISSAGVVLLRDCTVRGFDFGVSQEPTVSGKLVMERCAVLDSRYGIVIQPKASSAAVDAIINDCLVEKTVYFNIYLNPNIAGSTAKAIISRCTLTNGDGAVVVAAGADGTAYAYLADCLVSGQTSAALTGNNIISFGGNRFVNNQSDGTFAATLPRK